jgi:predicted GNAT family N-acyltransferase
MALPATGKLPLLHADRHINRTDITVHVVRSMDDLQKVMILRALTYMAEQACPYEEEYDGNDLCAMHLLAHENGQPAGSLRLRFFNGFCKIERVCIDPRRRGGAILNFLMAHAFEVISRKGYTRALAYIQERLEGMWQHVMTCSIIKREGFGVSGYDYLTLDIPVPQHPEVINFDSDPFLVLRPEGDWDRAGVLDPKPEQVAAANEDALEKNVTALPQHHGPQPTIPRAIQELRARAS